MSQNTINTQPLKPWSHECCVCTILSITSFSCSYTECNSIQVPYSCTQFALHATRNLSLISLGLLLTQYLQLSCRPTVPRDLRLPLKVSTSATCHHQSRAQAIHFLVVPFLWSPPGSTSSYEFRLALSTLWSPPGHLPVSVVSTSCPFQSCHPPGSTNSCAPPPLHQ